MFDAPNPSGQRSTYMRYDGLLGSMTLGVQPVDWAKSQAARLGRLRLKKELMMWASEWSSHLIGLFPSLHKRLVSSPEYRKGFVFVSLRPDQNKYLACIEKQPFLRGFS